MKESATRPADDGREPPREVLLRGLSVLEALNHRTVSSVEQLAHSTHLPKPTVVRMLNLLVGAGYVQRLPNRRGYVLDESVQTLSAGFRSHDLVVQLARPILSAFTATTRWPLSLATRERHTMRVRTGTLQESPYATEGDMRRLARRLPMLASALGRAYLAFCPDEERMMLLTQLQAARPRDPQRAQDIRDLPGIIARIRQAGHASSPRERDNPAVGIAVPVMQGQQVIACISLRYLARAMTEAEAARLYLAGLQETAAAIADAVRRNRA